MIIINIDLQIVEKSNTPFINMSQNAAGKMKPFVDNNFGFGMRALKRYPEVGTVYMD